MLRTPEPSEIVATLLANDEARRQVAAALDERGLLHTQPAPVAALPAPADTGLSNDGECAREAAEAAAKVKANWAVAVIESAVKRKRLQNDVALFIAELGLDEEDVAPPSLAVAKANAERQLARDPKTGEMFPLRAPLVVFDSMGVEIATYMRFVVYVGRLMAFATILNLSNLVINLDGEHADDLLSKAAINNAQCPTNSHGAIELMTSAVIVAFLFWMRLQMHATAKHIRAHLDENRVVSPANFSVMVDGCPPEMDAPALRRVCERFGAVVHVGIALNNRDLLLHLEARQRLVLAAHEASVRLLRAVRALRAAQGTGEEGGARGKMETARAEVQRRADAVTAHDARLKRRQQSRAARRHSCVGKAFVTFNRTDAALRCRNAEHASWIAGGDGDSGGGGGSSSNHSAPHLLRFRAPPDPSQVLWHNLQVRRWEQWARQACSTSIVLVMIVVGSAIISTANLAKPYIERAYLCEQADLNGTHHNYTAALLQGALSGGGVSASGAALDLPRVGLRLPAADGWPANGWSWPKIGNGCDVPAAPLPECNLGLFQTLPVLLGTTAALIFGHVIIFILVPVLSETLERPHFSRQREVSIFVKLSFFQVFNVVLTAYSMLHFQGETIRSWLGDTGALILNGLVGDCFIIGLGVEGLRPDVLVRRALLAPHAASQFRMNALYTIDSDIQLAFRLQLCAKIVTLALIFSPAIPLAYPIAFLFCFTAGLVDKWHFLRTVRPPPRADRLHVMYVMVCWWMPLAVLARLGFASLVYYSLPCGCEGGEPLLRPVQYAVVGGSWLLMVPVLGFIVREARSLCCAGAADCPRAAALNADDKQASRGGLSGKRRSSGGIGGGGGGGGGVGEADDGARSRAVSGGAPGSGGGGGRLQSAAALLEEGLYTVLAPTREDPDPREVALAEGSVGTRVEARLRETFSSGLGLVQALCSGGGASGGSASGGASSASAMGASGELSSPLVGDDSLGVVDDRPPPAAHDEATSSTKHALGAGGAVGYAPRDSEAAAGGAAAAATVPLVSFDAEGAQMYVPPLTLKLMETNLLLDPMRARLRRRHWRAARGERGDEAMRAP